MLWVGQAKAYDASATGSLTCKGYKGIGSDGEYLYYAPFYDGAAYHGRVLRQKIFAIFTEASTWSVYDAGTTDSLTCKGYSGAVFDGRFMYFVPENNGSVHGVVLRYDTTKPFASASSWDSYDAGTTDSLTCKGFLGAVFDGQFIYFIPYYNGAYNGNVLRLDTTKPFKEAGSWEAYNCGSLATGFFGAVIVENFLYLSPYANSSGAHGKVVRYDLSKPFKAAGSWEAYDVTAVNTSLKGFSTPCQDGKFIYFPNYNGSLIMRYDTEKPFDASGSYSYFDTDSFALTNGHRGCCVQGNYIVFSPVGIEYLVYDTTKPFSDSGSWNFKTCLLSGEQKYGFWGCHGDPNYIYFAPYESYDSGYHGVVGRIRVDPCPAQSLPTPGATEDTSEYTAYDPAYVTKLSSSVTASPDDVSCFASCFKDYEKDFFNGFEVRFGLRLVSVNDIYNEEDPDTTRLFAFSLSNVFNDAAMEEVGTNDPSVAIIITWDADGNVTGRKIHLIKGQDGSRSTGYSIAAGTTYYCKVVRTAGSATITLYIYSDSNYSTLVSTQTLTTFSTTGKWRFIYAVRGMYDPMALAEASWRVEGLKIVSY